MNPRMNPNEPLYKRMERVAEINSQKAQEEYQYRLLQKSSLRPELGKEQIDARAAQMWDRHR